MATHNAVLFFGAAEAGGDGFDDDGKRKTVSLMENRAVTDFDISAVFERGIFGEFECDARQCIFILEYEKCRVENSEVAFEVFMNAANIQDFLKFWGIVGGQGNVAFLREIYQCFDTQ